MLSLAVKYKPSYLDDLIGKDVVIEILKKQIETNTIKNSYIFSGASGCGKTTAGKIFEMN